MPDFFKILASWKKEILFLTMLSLVLATSIVFILPSKFLATTTALPANLASSDRANVFNSSIQELNSALGNPDDLDVIVGTARLDTIFIATVEELELVTHYNIQGSGPNALLKAAQKLKSESNIAKSEFGELKIKVWDKNNQLAPRIANTLMEKLASLHQNLRSQANRQFIHSLQSSRVRLQYSLDSLEKIRISQEGSINDRVSAGVAKFPLENQLTQYSKLITEYQLIIDSNPSALIVVEKARPALRSDKPERAIIIITATVLGFIFAYLIALVLEMRKRQN